MAKAKLEDLGFSFKPRSPAQSEAEELWRRSRVLILVGPAGCGKSATALGLALREVLRTEHGKLMLARPMVACEEQTGYLPGDLAQKLGPWMGPFYDVFGSLASAEWQQLERMLKERLETVPVGMLRGRTIRNGVLICDECQNCSYAQLKCILTRVGENGRLILSGDPDQSDRFPAKKSPLMDVANRLGGLDTVSVVKFDADVDQVRDPLITEILELLN